MSIEGYGGHNDSPLSAATQALLSSEWVRGENNAVRCLTGILNLILRLDKELV